MISHITLGVSDLPRSEAFYSRMLAPLGGKLVHCDAHYRGFTTGFDANGRPKMPMIWTCLPFDGNPYSVGNGVHLALSAPSTAIVDEIYTIARALDAPCEGAPGIRPQYHDRYYGAFFRDPDGNKIQVCCHNADLTEGGHRILQASSAKKIALWFYRNEGGQGVLNRILRELQALGHEVYCDFDMRRCRVEAGKVLTEDGVDISAMDCVYIMNADEQSQHQKSIYHALEIAGTRLVNTFRAFDGAQDKFEANARLRNAGILVPDSVLLPSRPSRQDVESLFAKWGTVVVKARRGHGGLGVQRFDDVDRLYDYFLATSDFNDSFYCEQFVDFGDTDIRVDLINGQLVGGYSRRRDHYFKTNVHSGAKMLPLPPPDDATMLACRAAAILGVNCTIVDIVREVNTGKLYVLEVNPQLGVFTEAGLIAGVNTVQSAADIHPIFAYDDRKIDMLIAALNCAVCEDTDSTNQENR